MKIDMDKVQAFLGEMANNARDNGYAESVGVIQSVQDHLLQFVEETRAEPASVARNYPEDSGQENGNYNNPCYDCGNTFIGNKHRRTCKQCAQKPVTDSSVPQIVVDALEAVLPSVYRVSEHEIMGAERIPCFISIDAIKAARTALQAIKGKSHE